MLRYEGNAREDAAGFLRSTKSSSGIESTNFIQRVPVTVEKGVPGNEAFVSEVSQLEAAELLTWVLPPETDPTVMELARKIREDLDMRLNTRVLSSKEADDDYSSGAARIVREVRDFKEEFLGRDVGGKRVRGLYRAALEQSVAIHRDRFRVLLQEYLLMLLNGSAPDNKDYQQEKRGRLGQAQAVLSHVALYFSSQADFFERVKARRAKQDELRSAQQEAGLQLANMQADAGRGSFIGTFIRDIHPALKAQHAYINAEQELIDIEVIELFFEFLEQASDTLRLVTEEFKGALDSWVSTLAVGFSGTFSDPGLYRELNLRSGRHAANRTDKERIEVHEYVTDAKYEDSLYLTHSEGKFAEALTRMTWGGEQHNGAFRLTLSGCAVAGTGPVGGHSATERNAEFLLKLGRGYFAGLRNLTIADRLVERDALRLANMLLDKCSPLIRYDPTLTGGAQEMHYFVCVNEGNHKGYFNEVRAALKRLGSSAKDNQVLDSSSPYTCTILATADVIASQGLFAYISAEKEYNNHPGDARLLHVFPAEVNAVHLEQQLPKIHEPRRRFSHVLTTMLEDRKIVEEFILAYLYRLIRLERANGISSQWVLFLPSTQRRGYDQYKLTPTERQPSLFHAMECFAFRKADFENSARPINFVELERELRSYEERVSGGNESRLINLLEQLIDSDIEPLRRDADLAHRDLGSLMRLIVDEIVEGLYSRLKSTGRQHDQQAQPLIDVVAAVPAPAPPVMVLPAVTVPSEYVGNGGGSYSSPAAEVLQLPPPVEAAAPNDPRIKLKRLKELFEEGLLEEDEYKLRRKEILDQM